MKSLGIDIGSSSVKVSLLDIETGKCVASSTNPSSEMPIKALENGWAEQDPQMWWQYVCEGIGKIGKSNPLSEVKCIGITYQMHGLVCIGGNGRPVRDSIIWCDSRAVGIGNEAMEGIGREKCLSRLLNSPGNFTASKLAWVIRNEAETFATVEKFFLPGDYIAYCLSGDVHTTETGLSEQILWDYKEERRADFVASFYGIPEKLIPDTVPAIGIQARTSRETEALLGIPAGTPISYRAGDQPNNAFSLNVLDPGEIAATGGTSGVVYGVTDVPKADPLSRVNTFVHVSHRKEHPRYGILLCINGTGIMNAWIRRNFAERLNYDQINELAGQEPAGADGVCVLPFGNGADRVLENRFTGASVTGLDLNRHSLAHVLRATQEGIAFSFRYGIDIMKEMGLQPNVIRAGKANLFLSPLFRQTVPSGRGAQKELSEGEAARGAGGGAAWAAVYNRGGEGRCPSRKNWGVCRPAATEQAVLENAYRKWKAELEKRMSTL